MTYALVRDGKVVAYPYSFRQLRNDNPQVSFREGMSDADLAGFGVEKVVPADRPTVDMTQDTSEVTPALVDGVWTQQWAVTAAPAEKVAERQKAAELAAERDAAKQDAWIAAFLAMTPDEAKQYVLNNGGPASPLLTIVARLAYATRVLARREFGV